MEPKNHEDALGNLRNPGSLGLVDCGKCSPEPKTQEISETYVPGDLPDPRASGYGRCSECAGAGTRKASLGRGHDVLL